MPPLPSFLCSSQESSHGASAPWEDSLLVRKVSIAQRLGRLDSCDRHRNEGRRGWLFWICDLSDLTHSLYLSHSLLTRFPPSPLLAAPHGDKPLGFPFGNKAGIIISSPCFRPDLYSARSTIGYTGLRCRRGGAGSWRGCRLRRRLLRGSAESGSLRAPRLGVPVWHNSGSFSPKRDLGRKQRIRSCG